MQEELELLRQLQQQKPEEEEMEQLYENLDIKEPESNLYDQVKI